MGEQGYDSVCSGGEASGFCLREPGPWIFNFLAIAHILLFCCWFLLLQISSFYL